MAEETFSKWCTSEKVDCDPKKYFFLILSNMILNPRPSIYFSLFFSISDRFGYDIKNCSRYWHVFDFDASTAKFKIYQNKLMPTAPILPKKSIVDPNCSCLVKNDISSDDVINSAGKISVTAENLMVDKLCVNEMKNIYDNSSRC